MRTGSPSAEELDELAQQHIEFGVVARDRLCDRLQPFDIAAMVGPQHIDHALVAANILVAEIGDVGREVGVGCRRTSPAAGPCRRRHRSSGTASARDPPSRRELLPSVAAAGRHRQSRARAFPSASGRSRKRRRAFHAVCARKRRRRASRRAGRDRRRIIAIIASTERSRSIARRPASSMDFKLSPKSRANALPSGTR